MDTQANAELEVITEPVSNCIRAAEGADRKKAPGRGRYRAATRSFFLSFGERDSIRAGS
jgi:hypothetical protein